MLPGVHKRHDERTDSRQFAGGVEMILLQVETQRLELVLWPSLGDRSQFRG